MGERPLVPERERLPERPSDPPWVDIGFDRTANGRWPTYEQITEAYPMAAPYVQALMMRRRGGIWTMPSGDPVQDRDPLPEDFLPPAEALRMREIGDPFEAMATSRSNDAKQ